MLQTPAAHSLSVPTLNAEQAIRLWFPRKISYEQYHRNEFTSHNVTINESANLKQRTGKQPMPSLEPEVFEWKMSISSHDNQS